MPNSNVEHRACIYIGESLLYYNYNSHNITVHVDNSMWSFQRQGYAAAKSLAALAGKVRLAVAGKFPIIPKGCSGLVEQLLAG